MTLPLAGAPILATDLATIFATNTDGWTSYTPTWTQSATISKTVVRAAYMKIGRLVVVNVSLLATSAGTANNAMVVSLPVTASGAHQPIGAAFFNDNGTALYTGSAYGASTTTVQFLNGGSASAFWGQTGGGFTAAIASGDNIAFTAIYESAA